VDPGPGYRRGSLEAQKGTGSNEPLLELVDEGMFIAGIKVLTNPSVDAATFAWGIDSTRTKTVLRLGTEVQRFDVPRQDAIDVRAIARVGFAFLHTLRPTSVCTTPPERNPLRDN
jgi:hypothetical protein